MYKASLTTDLSALEILKIARFVHEHHKLIQNVYGMKQRQSKHAPREKCIFAKCGTLSRTFHTLASPHSRKICTRNLKTKLGQLTAQSSERFLRWFCIPCQTMMVSYIPKHIYEVKYSTNLVHMHIWICWFSLPLLYFLYHRCTYISQFLNNNRLQQTANHENFHKFNRCVVCYFSGGCAFSLGYELSFRNTHPHAA